MPDEFNKPDDVNNIAERIMRIALEDEDELVPAAEELVEGCKALGWNIEKTCAFLLTIAVDAHIDQAQEHNQGDALANALDALARVLGTGADAIREAINDEMPTAEALSRKTGEKIDQVVQLTRPEGMSVERFDAAVTSLSKRFPTIAYIVSSGDVLDDAA